MEPFTMFLTAVRTLLWPLIVFYVIRRFSAPLARVIESTSTRKFSVKMAGTELSAEEASEQQLSVLADLQDKVAKLEAVISARSVEPMPPGSADANSAPRVNRILWVDDEPRNNVYLVALLNKLEVQVEIALSTSDGLRLFGGRHYDAIITDMKRPEGDWAGIDLTRQIRTMNQRIPIYFFTGGWAARNLQKEVKQAGGNGITSSMSTLMTFLLDGAHPQTDEFHRVSQP